MKKLPHYIMANLQRWAQMVEAVGLLEVRKVKGFHDEPLKGKRKGQRSIRLSRSYRAIYIEKESGEVHLVIVEEVNKHEY